MKTSLVTAVVVLLLVASAHAAAAGPNESTPEAAWSGVFIGHDAAGRPIYRLPPIKVEVDRKTALAQIEAEDKAAASQAAAKKVAAKAKAKPSQASVVRCETCVARDDR